MANRRLIRLVFLQIEDGELPSLYLEEASEGIQLSHRESGGYGGAWKIELTRLSFHDGGG
jgi:hypothetical protein